MAQADGHASCAAIACGARAFDTPAGVADEIAYVGAERQDRYEHYEWNFRAREVVGTGLQRTDIPMRELTPPKQRRVAGLLRRLGIAALAERRFLTLVLWRAPPGADRARARQPAAAAAAR